jgi:biotin-(acetyl-CoA carboxylase) ligase
LETLVRVLDEFARAGLEPFLPLWNRFDLYRGERVELRWGAQRMEGIHRGIDRQGSLRLAVDGQTRVFRAGEVSLRGKG